MRLYKRRGKRTAGKVNDREREVIRLRYGLEDGRTHTLEEIGENSE